MVEDLCVRISPYPLTWDEAEDRCKSEGGHLLHILSEAVQQGVVSLIARKKAIKDFFTIDQWSTGLSSSTDKFWIGGTVLRQDDWRWVGSLMNFTKYSYWSKGTEGQGCGPVCYDFHGLVMDRTYQWQGDGKAKPYPYICASDCAVGYAWRPTARRCVKIVNKDLGRRTQSQASLYCAQDEGRLLSINSCQEFEGLNYDLWTRDQSTAQAYWIGFYVKGFDNYFGQQRTSYIRDTRAVNSYGQLGLEPGGDKNCGDQTKVVMDTFSSSTAGFFGHLAYTTTKNLKLELTEFSDADTDVKMMMCERDTDWKCPEGWTLFQEHCYRLFSEQTNSPGALHHCSDHQATVGELHTKMHLKFVRGLARSLNISSFWVGLRRHVNTVGSSEDGQYRTLGDFPVLIPSSVVSSAASNTDDCAVLSVTKFDFDLVDCYSNASILCQTEQSLSDDLLFSLPQPRLLLPLDQISGFKDLQGQTESTNNSRIAFSFDPVPQSGLLAASHFTGSKTSYIDTMMTDNYFKNGLTISMWIYLETIDDKKRQYLFDTSGRCETGTETFNNFQLYLEKRGWVGSRASADTSGKSSKNCQLTKPVLFSYLSYI